MGKLVPWYEKIALVTAGLSVGGWALVGWLLAQSTPGDSITGTAALGWLGLGLGVGIVCIAVWVGLKGIRRGKL